MRLARMERVLVVVILSCSLLYASPASFASRPTCMGKTATIVVPREGPPGFLGTKRDDVIVGTPDRDTINAGEGDDIVCGGGGGDQLRGWDGRDQLDGGDGRDFLYGDCGCQKKRNGKWVNLPGYADRLVGGEGDDYIVGYGGDDVVDGGIGDDTVFGDFLFDRDYDSGKRAPHDGKTSSVDGDDTLDGGPGPDALYGSGGVDVLIGEDDDAGDFLAGGASADKISSRESENGKGHDFLAGGDGNDTIHLSDGRDDRAAAGDLGNDTIYLGGGNDVINPRGREIAGDDVYFGGDGNDVIQDSTGRNELNGEAGDDYLDTNTLGDDSGGGTDVLSGGPGEDEIEGGDSDDILNGDADHDVMDGGGGDDALNGGDDNDVIQDDSGQDNFNGGDGDDSLDSIPQRGASGGGPDVFSGGPGEDFIEAGDFDDILRGDGDADSLHGGGGDDDIRGDDGDDRLYGETGNDSLDGGEGTDVCTDEGTAFISCESEIDTPAEPQPESAPQPEQIKPFPTTGTMPGREPVPPEWTNDPYTSGVDSVLTDADFELYGNNVATLTPLAQDASIPIVITQYRFENQSSRDYEIHIDILEAPRGSEDCLSGRVLFDDYVVGTAPAGETVSISAGEYLGLLGPFSDADAYCMRMDTSPAGRLDGDIHVWAWWMSFSEHAEHAVGVASG